MQTATLITIVNGCTDPEACNYEVDANVNDGSCEYAEEFYTCNYPECVYPSGYVWLSGPLVGEIICEELVVMGCMDPENPAFNPRLIFDL